MKNSKNAMKLIGSILGTLAVIFASAQNVNRQVIASAGDYANASGVQVEYTVGETVIGNLAAANVSIAQGFHQSFDLGIGVSDLESFSGLIIFPNPVITDLTVRFGTTQGPGGYQLMVIGLSGQILMQFNSNEFASLEHSVSIDVSELPASGYVLQIRNVNNGEVKNLVFEKVE